MRAIFGLIALLALAPPILGSDCDCTAGRPCVGETIPQEVAERERWAYQPPPVMELSMTTTGTMFNGVGTSLLLLLIGVVILNPFRRGTLIRLGVSDAPTIVADGPTPPQMERGRLARWSAGGLARATLDEFCLQR